MQGVRNAARKCRAAFAACSSAWESSTSQMRGSLWSGASEQSCSMGRNASVPSSSSRTFFSSRLGAQAKEAGVSDMAAAAEAGSAGGSTQTGNVYKDTAIGRGLGFIRDTLLLGTIAGGIGATFLGMNYTLDECKEYVEKQAQEGGAVGWLASTVGQQYVKTRESLEETIATYSKPSSDALLPAMDLLYPPQLAPMVRTLVIDLEDTIVHSEYRRDRGWITYKRPGVQEFLQAAWNLGWEVVLYTDQDHMSAEPIMEQIDPGRRFVPFRLFRDSTLFTGGLFKPGLHLRDLSRLNRDMKRVLYLTWDVKTGEKQPDNVVMIRKWEGDVEDRQLLDMIPVLQMITQTHVADVRDVARAYRGKELPVEFRERVRQQAQTAPQRKGFFGR